MAGSVGRTLPTWQAARRMFLQKKHVAADATTPSGEVLQLQQTAEVDKDQVTDRHNYGRRVGLQPRPEERIVDLSLPVAGVILHPLHPGTQ